MVGTLRLELRLALRMLRRMPLMAGLAAGAVAAAVAAFVLRVISDRAVLAGYAEYRHRDRLAYVGWPADDDYPTVPGPVFLTLHAAVRHSAQLAGVSVSDDVVLLEDGRLLPVTVAAVSPEFFEVAGIRPVQGRPFGSDELRSPVVLVSEDFARAAALAATHGPRIVVGRQRCLVLGTMPAGARVLERYVQVWRPLDPSPRVELTEVGGVRRPAITVPRFPVLLRARNDADLSAVVERVSGAAYGVAGREGFTVRRIDTAMESATSGWRGLLGVLSWLALTLAGLATAGHVALRVAERSREFRAIVVLGGGAGTLWRPALLEAFMLCVVGGLAGTMAASWTEGALVRLLIGVAPVEGPPRLHVLAAAAATSAGLWGVSLLASVASAGLHAESSADRTLRANAVWPAVGAAVGATVLALSLAAGAWARTAALAWRDRGFDPRGVYVLALRAAGERGEADRGMPGPFSHLVERMAAVPGVAASGAASALPIGRPRWRARVRVWTGGRPGAAIDASLQVVDAGFVRAMGLRLAQGRALANDEPEGDQALWVTRAFERCCLSEGREGATVEYMLRHWPIAGIFDDIDRGTVERHVEPEIFLPARALRLLPPSAPPFNVHAWTLLIRWTGDRRHLERAISDLVKTETALHVGTPRPMRELLLGLERETVAATALATAIAICAGAVCVSGVASVSAVLARRRRRELAIRIALGASPARLLRSELARWSGAVAGGAVAGIVAIQVAAWIAEPGAIVAGASTPWTTGLAATLATLGSLLAAAWPLVAAVRASPARTLQDPDG